MNVALNTVLEPKQKRAIMFAFWKKIKNRIFGILEPIFSGGIFEPVMLLTAYLYHRYLKAVIPESTVKIVSTKK